MSNPFELRLTTAGRAAIADGANRGINKISFTKFSIGSGFGPSGAANDARAALRNERHSAAVTGTTAVAGEIALFSEIATDAAYDVREIGLWGRQGAAGAETLYAFWTDPAEKFAAAVDGSKIIVGGGIRINPDDAELAVTVATDVTIESQGLLPAWLLPMPHVETATHQLAVQGHAAAQGGTVSVAAAQELSVAESTAGGSGFARAFSTPAWANGADLDVNSTYYLRAQVSAAGELALYLQQGADSDLAPDSGRGTPDGANGGGFASTPFDARLAKISTGAASTVPAIVRYALDASEAGGVAAWSATTDYSSAALAWGSDGELYLRLQASGPSTAAGAVDPVGDADRSHWRPALKISGHPAGVPAKDDELLFGDKSAVGKPNRTVEIQKLPGALAPAGGVVEDKKYALKALAGGAYELATIVTLLALMPVAVVVMQQDLGPPGGTYSPDLVGLTVPPGRYTVIAGAQASYAAQWARLYLQRRPASGGAWVDLGDTPRVDQRNAYIREAGVVASEPTEFRLRGAFRTDRNRSVTFGPDGFLAAIEETD